MPPTPAPTRDTLVPIAVVVSLTAVLIAVIGVGLGMRAIDQAATNVSAGGAAPSSIPVTLSEFSIEPAGAQVAVGGNLTVANGGAMAHDLAIEGTSIHTPMLAPGDSAELSLAGLEPGTYTIYCTVPGHREAGMVAELVITEGTTAAAAEGGGASDHGGGAHMSATEMDEVMAEVMHAFPAETKGKGGQLLEPTVTAEGIKRFELTAEIVDWEVEPGKTVKAWTYNGQVPGPTMQVAHGDRIQVVLRNQLPESTSIHFHGLLTPNAMDGVPDLTQAPVKPGEAFTYDFVAKGPAVGMYHSHHNAAVQVPNGLAGTILVGELPLPAGVTVSKNYPMMLSDAGVIGFGLNGKSFPATEPVVVKQGEWVLVHYLNEGVQVHPMHLHGLVQLVIAKDGFPLPQPYRADTVNVAPGERFSVLVHADAPGVWAWHCHVLPHAERSTGMFGMVTAMIVEPQ